MRGITAGNLKLASEILFIGNTYTPFKDIFRFLSIKYFEKDTYRRYQNRYLFSVVNDTWVHERNRVLSNASLIVHINIIGDGR